jgi:hypothetical protein
VGRTTITMITALVLTVSAAPGAQAQDLVGFRSPSGNIHCQFFTDDGVTFVRCDLRQTSNRPPPRPRDCDLEWGQAFEVSTRSSRGALLCHGDTVQDNRLPVLPYGERVQYRGLSCDSDRSGVTCRNAAGHGFALSRARQQVF